MAEPREDYAEDDTRGPSKRRQSRGQEEPPQGYGYGPHSGYFHGPPQGPPYGYPQGYLQGPPYGYPPGNAIPLHPMGSQSSSSQQSTTVVVNQPESKDSLLLVAKEGKREWSTGFCGCFDDFGGACLTVCCLPYVLTNLSSRQGDCACMPCCVGYHTAVVAMRSRVRTMGGIRGNICNDCMAALWCPYLAVCQLDREMKNMGL